MNISITEQDVGSNQLSEMEGNYFTHTLWQTKG